MNKTRSAYLDWLADVLTRPKRPDRINAASGDLILGYATGYGVAEIAPFVRSLRAVFSGDAALVVDQKPEILRFLAEHRIEALPADRGTGPWAPHPVVERFAAYAAFLDARSGPGQVILTDVRDVIFQKDPFEEPFRALEFFEENEGRSLDTHAFNLKHLRALAGDRLIRSLADRPCVCVGVVAGPRSDVLRFCRSLLMLCAIPRSGVGGAFGADQAACNLIAHLELVDAEIRPNFGRVATIGLTAADRLRLENGVILNPDGGVSPIIHQYDRLDFLDRFVRARWAAGEPLRSKKVVRRRATVLASSIRRRLPEWR